MRDYGHDQCVRILLNFLKEAQHCGGITVINSRLLLEAFPITHIPYQRKNVCIIHVHTNNITEKKTMKLYVLEMYKRNAWKIQ